LPEEEGLLLKQSLFYRIYTQTNKKQKTEEEENDPEILPSKSSHKIIRIGPPLYFYLKERQDKGSSSRKIFKELVP